MREMRPVSTHKRELRKEVLEMRSRWKDKQIFDCSAQLSKHLFASNLWREASMVLAFVGSKGEPDTRKIFDECWSLGKQLYLPRVVDDTYLSFHRVEPEQNLETGKFGIPEPEAHTRVWDHDLSSFQEKKGIVLVPGLGFDRGGNRLGYGKGYYDRFLRKYRSCGRLIGVCWKQMLYEGPRTIPVEEHDISVDWLLSQEGIVSVEIDR